MNESHITSVDALRQFLEVFSHHVESMAVIESEMDTRAAEARLWIKSCREQSRNNLIDAKARLEQCKRQLHQCQDQEDDDYVPDCSYEEAAIEKAEEWLDECSRRHNRIKELENSIHRYTGEFFRTLNKSKRILQDRSRQGQSYIKTQISRTEEALSLRRPAQ